MNDLISRLAFYYPSTLLKGEPIFFLMDGYLQRQYWSEEQLKAYQFEKLKSLLNFAFVHSPFYKDIYQREGISPNDIKELADLSLLPSINKKVLIEQFNRICSSKSHLFSSQKTTGGSTGEPVRLYKNPMALARERCATWRGYEWAGIKIGDPQLRFWGVPHDRMASWTASLTDVVANRMRISAFNLTEESLQEYYRKAIRFKPRYLYGYVSAVEEFARFVSEKRLGLIPSLKAVITTSEVLSPITRIAIEAAFGVKVFNEYGCGEVGSIAHECEKGNMHIMADNLILENESGYFGAGEILVTDLFNYSTPLIRYRLGDFATFSPNSCECGRGLPVIESVHGRAYDLLTMPDGRQVHPESVIYVFEGIQRKTQAFDQFQVIQASIEKITVRIVPNHRFNESLKLEIINRLRKELSEKINYDLEIVSRIYREPSGKMRVVKRCF